MEPSTTDWQRQPRSLSFRSHYRWYAGILAAAWVTTVLTACWLASQQGWQWQGTWREHLTVLAAVSLFLPALYLAWLHRKLTRSVQVFPDRLRVTARGLVFDIPFHEVEQLHRPFGSFMRLVMRDGGAWWFSAALERPDYLLEGLWKARPELIGSAATYEEFRLKLVQADHHQKRKEWFFRHSFVDVLNWVVFPLLVLGVGYNWQSQDIIIHSKGIYFFRLAMFTLIATIGSAFVFSIALKRWVFDRAVVEGMAEGDKKRDLAWEDEILQRAKAWQLVVCAGLMGSVLWSEANLYSVTRLRDGAQVFRLTPGKTVLVDNRYNCVSCSHSVRPGDVVVFGRGTLGKVLAVSGDVIAQTRQGDFGRSIASETLTEVPTGQVALQTGPQGKDVVMVKLDELVGKIEKP